MAGFMPILPRRRLWWPKCLRPRWRAPRRAGSAISQDADQATALERIVDSYLDPAHVAAAERGCMLTTLGPEMARRPESRGAITNSIRRMTDALARCLPGRRRQRALAALSAMVGAVVLARLSDNPALAAEFLGAARKAAGLR